MRKWLVWLSLLGLVLSGLEGAAEGLDADACDSGPGFELHHDLAGAGGPPDGDDGQGGESPAAHFCHCAAHGVPLAAGWAIGYRAAPAPRLVTPGTTYSSLTAPPPIRPPIA